MIYLKLILCVFTLLTFNLTAAFSSALAQNTSVQDDAPREKTFNAESFLLGNGMQVVLIPNHRAPVITHMVWYKAGAADEPDGISGIAHFMEHLMFKGSGDLGPGEFSKKVRSLGGNDNAFTSQDYTAYYQSISKDELETVMRMEADRMRDLSPPEEHVTSERQVIIEERRQRIDNNPAALLGEQASSALYLNHPYSDPVIGWKHEMEELSRNDALAWHSRHYAPNNAILIISGDVTLDELKPLAEDIYGSIPSRATPPRRWSTLAPRNAEQRLTLAHPDVQQPQISIALTIPNITDDKQTALAMDILSEIAGGGPTSRLYTSLVVDQKLASSAGFRANTYTRGPGKASLYATPLPGTSPENIITALKAELEKLATKGVTEQEVADAKTRLQDAAILSRDSLTGPAMIFGYGLMSGETIDDIEYWPYDIEALTLNTINQAAATWLSAESLSERQPVISILLPQATPEDK